MYKGRLFTFGCSFTEYKWPTWADLLGQEFQEYYNFGQCGGGNLFIACSVAEADARYKFTSDDTVLVMWTNVTREDRYTDRWLTPGNIYTQEKYSHEFIEKFVTVRGCYIRDLSQIHLTKCLLENSKCKFKFMSMVDIDNFSQYKVKKDACVAQMLKVYKDTVKIFLPSVHKVIFNYDWWSIPLYQGGPLRQDPHPTPLEHIQYINKVLPDYQFSKDTITFAQNISNEIESYYKKNYVYSGGSGNRDIWQAKLKVKNTAKRF